MFFNSKINILFPITVFFIFGTACNNFYPKLFCEPTPLLGVFMLVFLAILTTYIAINAKIFNKSKIITKTSLLIFFILSLSFTSGIFFHQRQIAKHKEFLKKIENNTYNFVATISDVREMEKSRNQFYIELLWESENKKIALYTNTPHEMLVGDRVEIKNAKFKAINNLDFIKYLVKENIATTLFIDNLEYNLIYRPKNSVARWLNNKKSNILENLEFKMNPVAFSSFSSIFLGNKNISKDIESNIKNKFKEWGILHILARSGLHLVIFLLICELILKFLPISFFIKQIIILILSFIYMLLSWTSVSFNRAFYALLLHKFCPFINKKTDALHVVITACLSIIIFNPIQIFFLDFQLSFILTLSLAIFSKIDSIKKRAFLLENAQSIQI